MPSGRRRQPVNVVDFDNTQIHFTKAQIAARAKAEKMAGTIGKETLTCPREIRENKRALVEWNHLTKINRETEADFLRTTDAKAIAAYCMLRAEYLDLVHKRAMVNNCPGFTWDEETEAKNAIDDYYEGNAKRTDLLWKKIDFVLSLPGVLKIDSAIDAKVGKLIAFEDRLFLNPLARLKHDGTTKTTAQKPVSELSKFGIG